MRRSLLGLCVLAWIGGCGHADGVAPGTDASASEITVAVPDAPDRAPEDVTSDRVAPGPDEGGSEADAGTDAGPPPECTDATAWLCNDGNGCTEDACTDGVCVNAPIAGCCLTDAECDDGVECTVDTCNPIQQVCMHPFEDNFCCLNASDCDDGDACTQDICAAHRCVHPKAPECVCSNGFDCDDGNLCTSQVCTDGLCAYEALGGDGCCLSDGDCDDGDALTVDQCQLGLCWHHALACASDDDCAGPGVCSVGACVDGGCTYPSAGCCLWDQDCDDGQPLTEDHCLGGACVHALGVLEPCAAATDCGAAGSCATATCFADAGMCSYAVASGDGCCGVASDCATTGACSVVSCEAFMCQEAPVTGDQIWWSDDFSGGDLATWTVTSDATAASWQMSGAQATSPPWSLYYGRLPQQDYDVGQTAGSVVSPTIPLPPSGATGLRLQFARNALIEAISSTDQFWLEVVDAAGQATPLWTKNDDGGPGLGWKVEDLDLSTVVSGPFRLRFQFDSVDDVNNDGEGIYVDDVVVTTPCE